GFPRERDVGRRQLFRHRLPALATGPWRHRRVSPRAPWRSVPDHAFGWNDDLHVRPRRYLPTRHSDWRRAARDEDRGGVDAHVSAAAFGESSEGERGDG